jgi:hypothetical protein
VPNLGVEEPVGESAKGGSDDASNFDPYMLEDAMKPLYRGAKCTELAGTILLMNVCSIHGVSNNFTQELFTILHGHLFPEDNCLSKNYYIARSLTSKLGLSYRTIHAYEKGCILFRKQYSEAHRCPKCGRPRYRDEERKLFPLKVLRHFPVILRVQRMFRSPCLSNLMLWQSEIGATGKVATTSCGILVIRRLGSILKKTLTHCLNKIHGTYTLHLLLMVSIHISKLDPHGQCGQCCC